MNNLPFFIFNGVNSKDLGIVIKEMPPIVRAERNIESITVAGRNGDLHIDDGTYKSKKYSIVCILMDESKIDDIKRLFNGIGILEISTEVDREYEATIKNQVDFSKYLTYLKEFPLQFELQPIAYSKSAVEKNYIENANFNVGGTVDVSPKIIVNGVGKITLNNTQVELLESGITIDCDLMNCTKDNINKNDKVNLDDFPTLKVGENSLVLGSGIESVFISYKEGWL